MLAFHNEHIASCAFLTYFTPEFNNTTDNSSSTTLNNNALISATAAVATPAPVPVPVPVTVTVPITATTATDMVADKATFTAGIKKQRYQPYGYGYNSNKKNGRHINENLWKWQPLEVSADIQGHDNEINGYSINDQLFL